MDKALEKDISSEDKIQLDTIYDYKIRFISSMEDDLNTADAIASLFDMVKFANTNFNEKTPKFMIQYVYETLIELSKILGILSKKEGLLEEEILSLIEKRTQARKDKNYKLADEIRDELKEKGIILEDTQEGVKWKRI